MGKRYLTLLVTLAVFLFGCVAKDIKDNQVYLIQDDEDMVTVPNNNEKLNTEGRIPFQGYEVPDNEGRVLLTVSLDGKQMFFMEPMLNNKEGLEVLKGGTGEKVRIIRIEQESREEKIIAENIPFISLVQWNNTGKIVAFGGGERLTVYDTEKDKLLLENTLKNDQISYFFWSPKDDNKIYSENPSLSNGSIYYVNSQKKVEAYETKEQVYYKGKLDNDYYYATKWFTLSDKEAKIKGSSDGIRTIIVDKKGNTVKVLGEGRFRDSYRKSLLQVGDSGFGLYYTPDINKPEGVKILTQEYIFDAKFVDEGKIAYIVEDKDPEANLFFLYIIDKNGKELKKIQVSGSSIALLPDGKTGIVGGPLREKINFSENELEAGLVGVNEQAETEKEKIFKTLRKAINILYKFELTGEKDWTGTKKYFLDTNSPDQWAYFDLINKFNTASVVNPTGKKPYIIKMELKDLKISETGKEASVLVRASAFIGSGGNSSMDYALELTNNEGSWYVTGLSTFPHTERRESLEKIIKKYVSDAQKGKLFPGELEGKEVEIGQIQFWTSGLPHLAPDVESANYCKVYLKVNNKGKQEILKMVLDRRNQNYWKPIKLSRENLSQL